MYTRLSKDEGKKLPDTWMSDTFDELQDHVPFANRCRGRVLITGLGLSCMVHGLLKKPDVTRIDVVEFDARVVNLVAPAYADEPRVTVYHADAWSWTPPSGVFYDYAWHDIWLTISDEDVEQHREMKRRYRRWARHQECWVERQDRWFKEIVDGIQREKHEGSQRKRVLGALDASREYHVERQALAV